jgi:hypothetical protein
VKARASDFATFTPIAAATLTPPCVVAALGFAAAPEAVDPELLWPSAKLRCDVACWSTPSSGWSSAPPSLASSVPPAALAFAEALDAARECALKLAP